MEPIGIFGFFSVIQDILKWREFFAAVVEYRIQHYANAFLMAEVDQSLQLLVVPEMGIDFCNQ